MTANQGQQAIELHSRQAAQFEARYEQLTRDPYGSCFAYSRMRLERLLARYIPAQGNRRRLLDVGVGTGHHLAELRRRGYDAAGVDGSAEMLERARIANPEADLRQADVAALPFPDKSFDSLICIEVLRYVQDPEPCISEMARVLRPGGRCVATATPLLNLNGYAVVNRIAPLLPFLNLTQLKQFFTTSRRLRLQFARAGFRDVRVHGVYLGPINWVERLFPNATPEFLRRWERIDRKLADLPLIRELANMFLVTGIRA